MTFTTASLRHIHQIFVLNKMATQCGQEGAFYHKQMVLHMRFCWGVAQKRYGEADKQKGRQAKRPGTAMRQWNREQWCLPMRTHEQGLSASIYPSRTSASRRYKFGCQRQDN